MLKRDTTEEQSEQEASLFQFHFKFIMRINLSDWLMRNMKLIENCVLNADGNFRSQLSHSPPIASLLSTELGEDLQLVLKYGLNTH